MIPESLIVSFDDGCDDDTFIALFNHMVVEGLCVSVNEQDVVLLEWARTKDDRPGVRVQRVTEEGDALGSPKVIALEDIESWHVY